MNATSEKPTDDRAAWAAHYERLGRTRRVPRIRYRRGLSASRLGLLLLAVAAVIATIALFKA